MNVEWTNLEQYYIVTYTIPFNEIKEAIQYSEDKVQITIKTSRSNLIKCKETSRSYSTYVIYKDLFILMTVSKYNGYSNIILPNLYGIFKSLSKCSI